MVGGSGEWCVMVAKRMGPTAVAKDVLATAHEMAVALHRVGAMNELTILRWTGCA
jgi:hypothetical protein